MSALLPAEPLGQLYLVLESYLIPWVVSAILLFPHVSFLSLASVFTNHFRFSYEGIKPSVCIWVVADKPFPTSTAGDTDPEEASVHTQSSHSIRFVES